MAFILEKSKPVATLIAGGEIDEWWAVALLTCCAEGIKKPSMSGRGLNRDAVASLMEHACKPQRCYAHGDIEVQLRLSAGLRASISCIEVYGRMSHHYKRPLSCRCREGRIVAKLYRPVTVLAGSREDYRSALTSQAVQAAPCGAQSKRTPYQRHRQPSH